MRADRVVRRWCLLTSVSLILGCAGGSAGRPAAPVASAATASPIATAASSQIVKGETTWPTVAEAQANLEGQGYKPEADVHNGVPRIRVADLEVIGPDTAPAEINVEVDWHSTDTRYLELALSLIPQGDRQKVLDLFLEALTEAEASGIDGSIEKRDDLSAAKLEVSMFDDGATYILMNPG
jgi:hypothetical protein